MIKTILLDIEGTTTPIDFVHKTLFPFAKERIASFVAEHFAELSHEVRQLSEERKNDTGYQNALDAGDPASISAYLKYLIDEDRKSTPLKSIQGKIWEEGYMSGEIVSAVFDDVPDAFERWTAEGLAIAIYSSGSVLAQRLLFRHTRYGDLTKFISNNFDTAVGAKRDAESYRRIAAALSQPPGEILFVTDITAELDAARAAGMNTALSVRPGENGSSRLPDDVRIINSLLELFHV